MINDFYTRSLINAKNCRKLTKSMKQCNAEMFALVDAFNYEYNQYMCQDLNQTSSISVASKMFRHCISLHKKRLKAFGVSVCYSNSSEKETYNDRGKRTIYTSDGMSIACEVRQALNFERQLILDGVCISKDSRICDSNYYITTHRTLGGDYVCPNCGRVDKLADFTNGCDSCGSAFSIEDLKAKVNSLFFTHERERKRISFFNRRYKTGRTHSVIMEIKRAISDFSVEGFILSLDNKVKAIHYASNLSEVEAFVACHIPEIIYRYQNVLICDTGRYVLKDFYINPDNNTYNIELEMEAVLKIEDRTSVRDTAESMNITLSRKMGGYISNAEAVNGVANEADVDKLEHDWVITSYSS